MAHSASTTLRDVGKLAAYVGYNIGGSVLIGLGRTAIATYHLAKTALYKQALSEYSKQSRQGGFLKKYTGKITTWAGKKGLDAKKTDWEGELVRGLIEMIPVLGSAYFTYKDYKRRDVSVLGFKELGKMLDAEYALDSFIHDSKSSYNPLDYRLRKWLSS